MFANARRKSKHDNLRGLFMSQIVALIFCCLSIGRIGRCLDKVKQWTTGTCQDSCRVIYAARRIFCVMLSILSGFKATASMGCQFLV